jgi:hypothetical protein
MSILSVKIWGFGERSRGCLVDFFVSALVRGGLVSGVSGYVWDVFEVRKCFLWEEKWIVWEYFVFPERKRV